MPAGRDDQPDDGAARRELFSELARLETGLRSAVERRLRADHGQPLSTFEFLRVVSGRAHCRVHDISAELNITVGGTSKIVDRLAGAGYCQRRANPDDRRSSFIDLTDAGRQFLAGLTASVDDELRLRIGASLPDRALRQLTGALGRLRSAVRPPDAGPG